MILFVCYAYYRPVVLFLWGIEIMIKYILGLVTGIIISNVSWIQFCNFMVRVSNYLRETI